MICSWPATPKSIKLCITSPRRDSVSKYGFYYMQSAFSITDDMSKIVSWVIISVMVNLDFQFTGIWNQLGGTAHSGSVRAFLERINWREKILPQSEEHLPMGGPEREEFEERAVFLPAFTLAGECIISVAFVPVAAASLLHWTGTAKVSSFVDSKLLG